MAGKSDYLENAVLDHVLGGPNYSRAATVYIGLYSADPTDAGTGAELAGNGYARVAVTNDATNWPAAAGGAKANGAQVTFPLATGADWDEATHFGVLDANAAGNLLYGGPLQTPKTVLVGDTAIFGPGTLQITED